MAADPRRWTCSRGSKKDGGSTRSPRRCWPCARSLLVLILIRVDVHRVAVHGAIDGHADRSAAFLGQLTEQAGSPGQQGESAQQLDRQAEIRQRGAADNRPGPRQPATQKLIMDP